MWPVPRRGNTPSAAASRAWFSASRLRAPRPIRWQRFEEVTAAAQKAADACRTVGVALTPCILPAAGKPTFTIGDNEMEIGMGIHGEPGVRRGPLQSADIGRASCRER